MAAEVNDSGIKTELIAINKTLGTIAETLAKIATILSTPPPTPVDMQIQTGK